MRASERDTTLGVGLAIDDGRRRSKAGECVGSACLDLFNRGLLNGRLSKPAIFRLDAAGTGVEGVMGSESGGAWGLEPGFGRFENCWMVWSKYSIFRLCRSCRAFVFSGGSRGTFSASTLTNSTIRAIYDDGRSSLSSAGSNSICSSSSKLNSGWTFM